MEHAKVSTTAIRMAARSMIAPLMLAACFLAACGRSDSAPGAKPVAAQPAANVDAEIEQAIASLPVEETSAEDMLADEVSDIRRRHPSKNAQQLLEVPEVKARLGECLKELAQRKDLQERINASMAAAAAFMGLAGPPESRKFSLDLSGYSDARTDHMLTAIMSGRATPVVDFLVGEVGEATPELSFGGRQKSSNGISIEPVSMPPAKP